MTSTAELPVQHISMPSAVPRAPLRRLGPGGSKNKPVQFTPLPKPARSDACCEYPIFEHDNGSKVCVNCGTQISESNIVAEVTFGETSTGAATVQGGYVGENARHAKTLGAAASRRIGGQYQSREETERNGKQELRSLCPQLHVPSNVEDVAFNLWRLAAIHNFIQGRRTTEVAGVCLYAACRRDKNNTVLLMDISEVLHINVFRLGDVYKELNKTLYLEVHQHIQPIVEIEPLLMKYAGELEFGDKTRQVAEDALKIIKRMKRDWMVTGRHPAGLCGACIILAARMNNFRRTVREVVYVVKVADMTIATRLAEFKKTRSSGMTVQDFRSKALRIRHQHDPPSITAAADRQKKLESTMRKREARREARASVDLTDDSTVTSSRETSVASSVAATPPPQNGQSAAKRRKTTHSGSTSTATSQAPRRDADGFAIPAIPIDPALKETDEQSSKASKKSKKARQAVPLNESDFAKEDELEDEIEDILQDPTCVSSRDDAAREILNARARDVASQQRAAIAVAESQRLLAEGRSRVVVSDSIEIGEDEFADDPEVQNALLTEEQVQVKEKIWVTHNEDWLRAQQTKQLKRALDEAEGRSTYKKVGSRKKRGRIGDGSVLTEGGTPVASPMDAATRMLDKRAPKAYSKSVDYAALNRILGTQSGATTPAASHASAATTPAVSRAATPAPALGDTPASALTAQHDLIDDVAKDAEAARMQEPSLTNTAEQAQLVGTVEANAAAPAPADADGNDDENDDDDDVQNEEDEVDDYNEDAQSPVEYDHDEDEEYDAAQDDMTGDFDYQQDIGDY